MLLQTTNPMLIVFLLSLLPQFITPQHDYISRMTTLISIFAAVGLTVHLGYGFVAAIASHHLQNKKFLFWVNKVSAVLFWLLAIGVFWVAIYKASSGVTKQKRKRRRLRQWSSAFELLEGSN